MGLKLTRRHKSPNFYIRGTFLGVSVDESTGTDKRQIAKKLLERKEQELIALKTRSDSSDHTFSAAVISYIENGGERRFLNPLVTHFGDTILGKIDQTAVDKAARLLYPNSKHSTINRQLYTPMSAILRHASKRNMCAAPS